MIGFRCYNLSIQCSKGGERLGKEVRRRPSVGERERSVGCRRRILYSLTWYLLERDEVALASGKNGFFITCVPAACRQSLMARSLNCVHAMLFVRVPWHRSYHSIKGQNHHVPPSSRMRDPFHQGTFLLQCCLQSSNAWIEEQLEKRKSWRIAGIFP